MVIHVTIDTAEPLTGSASCCEHELVPFVGWLQLLRAVAELVGPPGCTSGACRPTDAVEASTDVTGADVAEASVLEAERQEKEGQPA